MTDEVVAKGLTGIVAAESTICRVDGDNGKLYYRGYPIEDLAEYGTFSEITYLLLYDKLPTAEELAEFTERMRASRSLPYPILYMIHNFPRDAHPMELLQSVLAYLSSSLEHRIEHHANCNCRDTLHQVVQMASVVATYARFRHGQDYVRPLSGLSHGGNFLYMLHGREPTPIEARAMDKCLIVHAEHGLDPSTFTARVVASTMSTCYSSISSAMGSLHGSLHGGASEFVMDMLDEIGDPARVEAWVDSALADGRRIPGMGHRIYRTKDPRATILQATLRELAEAKADTRSLDILERVEKVVGERTRDAGNEIFANVDLYSGAVYDLLGIERAFHVTIFAMSRVAGWLAHVLEQRADNHLFQPDGLYVGPEPIDYVPVELR